MKNIVLIGMPAVGKSTIGVLLAKSLLLSFTDTDLLIQEKYKKSLCDIINENGTKAFLYIEMMPLPIVTDFKEKQPLNAL